MWLPAVGDVDVEMGLAKGFGGRGQAALSARSSDWSLDLDHFHDMFSLDHATLSTRREHKEVSPAHRMTVLIRRHKFFATELSELGVAEAHFYGSAREPHQALSDLAGRLRCFDFFAHKGLTIRCSERGHAVHVVGVFRASAAACPRR